MGSGAVVFNVQPKTALLADSNVHVVRLYQGVQSGRISPRSVREHLEREGGKLLRRGEDHYYFIRDRFNASGDPLDFLFLNRACFNGVIRFNKKGKFNVPFCRKPERFRQAYITKICNQIAWIQATLLGKDWTFKVCDWRETLSKTEAEDFVYIDPPYIGRHTDYYNNWTEEEADDLAKLLGTVESGFAYSMWLENRHRRNDHLERWFSGFPIFTFTHFYHVGPTESLRNAMQEALIVSHKHAVDQEHSASLLRDFKVADEDEETDAPLLFA